jgi:hypothetical protein
MGNSANRNFFKKNEIEILEMKTSIGQIKKKKKKTSGKPQQEASSNRRKEKFGHRSFEMPHSDKK